MTGSLKLALLPIQTAATVCSAEGDGPYPPNRRLNFQIAEFTKSWKAERSQSKKTKAEGAATSDEYTGEIELFFNYIETIALHFPRYNFPGCDTEIHGFTSAIMTQIPWEMLPKEIGEDKLRRLFANKEFRQRCWQDYLRMSQNSKIGFAFQSSLGINKVVASILLEHDDICAELLALNVARIFLFVQIVPQIMLKVVTVAYQLWFSNKLATLVALNILTPLLADNNKNITAREQAKLAVAEIQMAKKALGDAKPHLDALITSTQLSNDKIESVQDHQVAYRCNLIQTLNQFNQQLTEYLESRRTDGYFYWLGIYNKQLSEKKNKLVEALQKDLNKLIADLEAGSNNHELEFDTRPVDHNHIINLSKWISRAEAMNTAYYNKHHGYFDGKGSLGELLRLAREDLQNFIPKSTSSANRV